VKITFISEDLETNKGCQGIDERITHFLLQSRALYQSLKYFYVFIKSFRLTILSGHTNIRNFSREEPLDSNQLAFTFESIRSI
jgi:hypothetical protein